MPKLTAIKVEIDSGIRERLLQGPLRNTQGQGAASWLRGVIIKELEREEAIRAGLTQIDPAFFQGGRA
jgi:hypothetical protein